MLANETVNVLGEKIEMDGSYQGGMNKSNESGVFSNESNNSEGMDSRNSSWIFWKNEIMDPDTFDPPCLQSTNLESNEQRITCDLSSLVVSQEAEKGIHGMHKIVKR